MKELTILLLCIIGLFIYINYIRKSLYLSLVTSTVDNKKYLVRDLKDNVQAANYLAEISQSDKVMPAVIEFVDIAGLVKGASKGEGLGNSFL